MPVITCIEDLKRLHRRRAPKMFFDYCESGSYTEQTFRENTSDFARIRLKQKVAVDMTGRSTESTMIGRKVAMPVALAPVGMAGRISTAGGGPAGEGIQRDSDRRGALSRHATLRSARGERGRLSLGGEVRANSARVF